MMILASVLQTHHVDKQIAHHRNPTRCAWYVVAQRDACGTWPSRTYLGFRGLCSSDLCKPERSQVERTEDCITGGPDTGKESQSHLKISSCAVQVLRESGKCAGRHSCRCRMSWAGQAAGAGDGTRSRPHFPVSSQQDICQALRTPMASCCGWFLSLGTKPPVPFGSMWKVLHRAVQRNLLEDKASG